MADVQHAVFDQCIVHIIDRRTHIRGILAVSLKFLGIDNILHQDAGNGLFQHIISDFLQVFVNGEIYVVSSFRIFPGVFVNIQDLSHIIYKDGFGAVFALELGLHQLLNPGLSDDRIRGILVTLFS